LSAASENLASKPRVADELFRFGARDQGIERAYLAAKFPLAKEKVVIGRERAVRTTAMFT
jgi:hypothetical protein